MIFAIANLAYAFGTRFALACHFGSLRPLSAILAVMPFGTAFACPVGCGGTTPPLGL